MTSQHVIAIDLGGTKVLSAIISETGEVLGRAKERTQRQKSADDVFRAVLLAVEGALNDSKVPLSEIDAIGVGAPGSLDPDRGVILFSPNLAFRNFPLAERLTLNIGRPAFVANDANMGVFGEWKMGAGQGTSNLIGIFVGTGIGGGLVINGKLHEGFSRSAGEIGHVAITLGGPRCGCGNRGCLEAMASRTAISNAIYTAVQKGEKSSLAGKFKGEPPSVRSKSLSKAYASGDKLARRILDEAAEILGIGIGSLINILAPEMVVLGGGFAEALGDSYLERVSTVALNWTFEVNRSTRIVRAQLGDDAIIQGAAAYARMKMDSVGTTQPEYASPEGDGI